MPDIYQIGAIKLMLEEAMKRINHLYTSYELEDIPLCIADVDAVLDSVFRQLIQVEQAIQKLQNRESL